MKKLTKLLLSTLLTFSIASIPSIAFAESDTPIKVIGSFAELIVKETETHEKLYQKKIEDLINKRRELLNQELLLIEAEQERRELKKAEGEKLRVEQELLEEQLRLSSDPSKLTREDVENLTAAPCFTVTGSFKNGEYPDEALCELEGTRGAHKLRPHASVAYHALAKAFERQFDKEFCITDSYRDYAAQVDLKLRKPVLGGTPGKSNHGLGLAVDLCGGIESFGSVQHEWMKENAPLFGYHQPHWASVNGSKPEAWHWEYITTKDDSFPA